MAEANVIKKQDLIESAKRCIVENGMNKVTLKAVAEGVGVTQGTVYYHFKTKDQLLLEVVKDMCRTSWERLEDMEKSTSDHAKEWIQVGLQSASKRNEEGAFYHSLFLSLLTASLHNYAIRDQISDLLRYENEVLKSQIDAAVGQEVDGISSDVWSVLINALIDGLAIQSKFNQDFDELKTYQALEWLLVKQLKET
ncbi:LOW QUALITY PROTEIN: transcriptional regulator, TetR family [Bacillus sp. JCM 19045]|nr:LOW QUALITY PROTEIN: transcriptional regulator, TetR family [Bacillus sp. JCM 19045]